MEAGFWQQKWERGEIAFHESETNPLLIDHIDKLELQPGGCVFLPLCGKTRDIAWLLGRNYRVVGAELSGIAVRELFSELGLTSIVSNEGKLFRYQAHGIDVFLGDIFDLTAEHIGTVDAIYDRAALVALPAAMRERYAPHLIGITGTAPQLLITLEYDQLQMDGPPFSIAEAEVQQHYGGAYRVQRVECNAVAGGLKGKVEAMESAWVLRSTG